MKRSRQKSLLLSPSSDKDMASNSTMKIHTKASDLGKYQRRTSTAAEKRRKRSKLMISLLWASLFTDVNAASNPPPRQTLQHVQKSNMQDCVERLHWSDRPPDGVLTQDEYSRAVSSILYNTEAEAVPSPSMTFDNMPTHVQDIFYEHATVRSCSRDATHWGASCRGIELDQSREYLQDICIQMETDELFGSHGWDDSIDLADRFDDLSTRSNSSPSIGSHIFSGKSGIHVAVEHRNLQTSQQCSIALAVGDTNRDDLLSRDTEYVRFVNQLSGQQFSGVSSFDALPAPLQANYDSNAGDSGEIDIAGSKPGQTPTADQEVAITALCESTFAVINGDGGNGDVPSPTPPPGDTPTGGSTADCSDTIPRNQCNTALSIADISRDDRLGQDEYIRFLNRLSGNEYTGTTFDSLPGNLKSNFNKFANEGEVDIFGAKPGQTPDADQDQFIDDFCCETDLAVDDPGAPTEPATGPPSPETPTGGPPSSSVDCSGTVSRSNCNTALSIADLSRDNLMDESEYVRFVSRLSSNQYAGSSFDQLPGSIQQNFDKFATTNGQIDIFGSKPGQSPTPEQDDFLDSLCCETDLAVQNPGEGSPVAPTPSGGQEPSAPTPAESFPPTFADAFCRTAMASSDFNRDDKLDESEYVRFLNRLTGSDFASLTFEELDEPLQANFAGLAASDGQIDIYGSKPGQTTNESQQANLEGVCVDTAVALDGGVSGPNPPSPTPDTPTPPSGAEPTFPPTFGETTCYTAMATADFDRDDYLNQDEYVRFLNRLTSNLFADSSFADLPAALTAVYEELAEGNESGIYIFGSKPGQTPTEEQEASLEKVCLDVAVALGQGPSGPGDLPAGAPTFAPGFSEVYNSFVVSNTIGLTASDLQSGANRQGLDDAYGEFAVMAMNQLAAVVANSRQENANLRRRKLAVAFSPDSDEIYLVLDSDCPEGTTARSACQTAFAKFDVTITDEDAQEVSDEYTAATQVMIANGLLQTTLTDVDPSSLLSIVNASFPVTTTLPPTPAPDPGTQPPSTLLPEEGSGGGGSLAGPIVGGLFGAILLCAAIGYVKVKGVPSMPSFGKGQGGKRTDDEGGGFGQDDDDDASGGGDDVGAFGVKKKAFGDEDDDDDDDDDDEDLGPERSRDKKKFGFGKKKKKPTSENQGFGDDDESSEEEGFGMNKTNYEFDEPSEVAEKDDDDGSAGDNDQVFGAGPASPGWGNSDDVFGGGNQAWGASTDPSNSAAGENFFGASTFGGDKEGEGSQSGSESDSYSSSEDSTYQSENVDGEENSQENSYDDEEEDDGSFSKSSAEDESSYDSGSTPASLESDLRKKNEEMEAAIASGDWDAVAKAADDFGKQDSSLEGSSKKDSLEEDDDEEDDSYSGSSRSGSASDSGASESSATTTTEQQEQRAEFRAQVDALVRLVLPDETDKVDAMMEQFKGREAELVSTLQTMQERSANQRARAAVHKSKNRPQRPDGADGAYAMGAEGGEGAAAGTAAIAAASLPIPAAGMFDEAGDGFGDDGQVAFDGKDAFGDGDNFGEEEGSYYSEEGSQSQYSDEGPFSDEESGSYTEDGSKSYRSGEGSQSQYSDEGSQSYVSGEGSQSQYSNERSGEGSQSYRSGEGSQSQYTDEGSQSYKSGEGSQSQYTEGSQSYQSGEGSHTGSQRSYDDEEGSFEEGPFSDEGSQYSGEEGSYYSDEEGEESHYSEEGSGSFGEG
jgi:hypothetical protein